MLHLAHLALDLNGAALALVNVGCLFDVGIFNDNCLVITLVLNDPLLALQLKDWRGSRSLIGARKAMREKIEEGEGWVFQPFRRCRRPKVRHQIFSTNLGGCRGFRVGGRRGRGGRYDGGSAQRRVLVRHLRLVDLLQAGSDATLFAQLGKKTSTHIGAGTSVGSRGGSLGCGGLGRRSRTLGLTTLGIPHQPWGQNQDACVRGRKEAKKKSRVRVKRGNWQSIA